MYQLARDIPIMGSYTSTQRFKSLHQRTFLNGCYKINIFIFVKRNVQLCSIGLASHADSFSILYKRLVCRFKYDFQGLPTDKEEKKNTS